QLKARAQDAKKSDATTKPILRPVRLVVSQTQMTFEGESTNWEELASRLEKVPDRANTILEIVSDSDDVSVGRIRNASQIGSKHGFKYISDVGNCPLGSRGGDPARTAGAADKGERPDPAIIARLQNKLPTLTL